MILLTFRPVHVWPDQWKPAGYQGRPFSPFRATYADTLILLERELVALRTTETFVQVDAGPGGVRLDGQIRADAKVNHPGVILTAETKAHGTLVYPCDKFAQAPEAFRIAAKTHHPDVGGDPETFRRITEARDVLLASG